MRGFLPLLRIAGPHRLILPLAVGAAAACRTGVPLEIPGWAVAAIGLGASVSLAVLRIWLVDTDARSPVRSSLLLATAATLATAVIAVALVHGLWAPPLLLLAAAALIVLYRLSARGEAQAIPVEIEAIVVEGALAAFMGMLVVARPAALTLSVLLVTIPLALATTASVYTHEPLRALAGTRTLGAWTGAVVAIPGLLTLTTAAILTGVALGFTAERALLAVAPASLAVFVSWLVLADPRPEWRVRRVRILSLAAAYALAGGMVAVVLAFP